MPRCAPDDLTPLPMTPAQRAALDGLELHVIEHPSDPMFDPAYAMLYAHFGALGQIESRDEMARLLAEPTVYAGVRVVCPLVYLVDPAGAGVAVGARYVAFEPATGVLSGLDGSVWCHPSRRGAGLGPLLVGLQLAVGMRLLAPLGAPGLVVELGDLEPISAADPDSLRRAVVWGRQGFRLIPHEVFPLTLVGMAAPGPGHAPPLPMAAVVRFPSTKAEFISKTLLHTLARHLEAAHAWAAGSGLAEATRALHRAIDAGPDDPVPLSPLPTRA